jgi:hypothetical protein
MTSARTGFADLPMNRRGRSQAEARQKPRPYKVETKSIRIHLFPIWNIEVTKLTVLFYYVRRFMLR